MREESALKKRMLPLLLCLFLLGGEIFATTAAAAAGGADDPLISVSWIADTFLPRLRGALADTAAKTLEVAQTARGAGDGKELRTLTAGESVLLTAGQQFTLLSGAARMTADAGEVIDVSAGESAGNGAARRYVRYIVCEDAAVYLDATESSVLKLSAGALGVPGCAFVDVPRSAWYYDDVADASRRGLIDGFTRTEFDPSGMLTGAQCVKLAACMHQLYSTGAVTLENSAGGLWYGTYVAYALTNGILDAGLDDFDSPVTRAQFVQLFYRALPESAYARINDIADGQIPDVAMTGEGAAEIYRFFRAGILTGYPADGTHTEGSFGPGDTISRAEVATIMNRMFDASARVRF